MLQHRWSTDQSHGCQNKKIQVSSKWKRRFFWEVSLQLAHYSWKYGKCFWHSWLWLALTQFSFLASIHVLHQGISVSIFFLSSLYLLGNSLLHQYFFSSYFLWSASSDGRTSVQLIQFQFSLESHSLVPAQNSSG